MTSQNRPLLLVAYCSQSHTRPDERFWIPFKTYAADGGARPNPGGTPFRQPCPACPFARAKGSRRYVSARNVSEPTRPGNPVSKARPLLFYASHTPAKKSRHTTSLDELAEPNYYSKPPETSSTRSFASHLTVTRFRLIRGHASALADSSPQPLHYRFSKSY
jgi:hypothetical protein